jgi:hypothetical protein
MIVCPWCGTNYLAFQPNCQNCGGPLHAMTEEGTPPENDDYIKPPPAPRFISNRYVWRLLSSDGWGIASLVFVILGVFFGILGLGLTVGIVTAFIGIPFFLMGMAFLVAGVAVFVWRYQTTQKVVRVLREGDAARGQINEVQENYSVVINGRHPWRIDYEYQVDNQTFTGNVTTLNPPRENLQPGKTVSVLYLASEPAWSSIYPHP